MEFIKITVAELERLEPLHTAYKRAIGEDVPTEANFKSLAAAIEAGSICFYGCMEAGALIGCCSVASTFSTFCYGPAGVFEDFYILPEHRHKGIARKLVRFAAEASGVWSLTVGCADCDAAMYRALGFSIPLGNMLAYEM